tara:strand:+ start:136 stop:699 length:564 start_codon:yes stop_codon:yes gene_type:complete
MSKMKKCKSCNKNVSKSAKICPHCGEKLKMGMFLKLVIGIIVIGVVAAIFSATDEEKADLLTKTLNEMESAPATNYSPSGKIAKHFGLMSDNTDIQRDNLEKELKDKIVEWYLEVYEVNISDEKSSLYRVQTASGNNVGTFVYVYARDNEEKSYIEGLKTGDFVKIKGRITGTSMRNLTIKDAILIR